MSRCVTQPCQKTITLRLDQVHVEVFDHVETVRVDITEIEVKAVDLGQEFDLGQEYDLKRAEEQFPRLFLISGS